MPGTTRRDAPAEGHGWTQRIIARIPAADQQIQLVVRQHVVALAGPAARTALGLAALLSGTAPLPLLLFAGYVALETRRRLSTGARTSGLVAVGVIVLLLVLAGPASSLPSHLLAAAVLLGWLGFDVADWHHDRLVVTTKRLYRFSGVLVQHVPSVALTGIAFIDASASPLGRALDYGTLLLDSVAQRDHPLASFSYLPHVLDVHSRILELRAAAMPKFPPPSDYGVRDTSPG